MTTFYRRLVTLCNETRKAGSGYTFTLVYHERGKVAFPARGFLCAWCSKVVPDQPNPFTSNPDYLKHKGEFTPERKKALRKWHKDFTNAIRNVRLSGVRTKLSQVQSMLPKGSECGPAYKVLIGGYVFDTRQLVPFLRGVSDCTVRVGIVVVERPGSTFGKSAVLYVQRKRWFIVTAQFNSGSVADFGTYRSVRAWLKGKRG